MNEALGPLFDRLAADTHDAGLLALRLAPLVTVSPALGLRSAPMQVRTGVLVVLTLALAPLAAGTSVGHGPLAALRELLFGVVFAAVASAPLLALEGGGRLADHARGAGAAELSAPHTGDRTSPLGQLALLAGLASYAASGGLTLAVSTLASTLRVHPLGSPVETVFVERGAEALLDALRVGVLVGAPVLVASQLVDLALAAASRAASRLPAHFVAMPLRAVAGLAAFALGLGAALDAARGGALDALATLTLPP